MYQLSKLFTKLCKFPIWLNICTYLNSHMSTCSQMGRFFAFILVYSFFFFLIKISFIEIECWHCITYKHTVHIEHGSCIMCFKPQACSSRSCSDLTHVKMSWVLQSYRLLWHLVEKLFGGVTARTNTTDTCKQLRLTRWRSWNLMNLVRLDFCSFWQPLQCVRRHAVTASSVAGELRMLSSNWRSSLRFKEADLVPKSLTLMLTTNNKCDPNKWRQ